MRRRFSFKFLALSSFRSNALEREWKSFGRKLDNSVGKTACSLHKYFW